MTNWSFLPFSSKSLPSDEEVGAGATGNWSIFGQFLPDKNKNSEKFIQPFTTCFSFYLSSHHPVFNSECKSENQETGIFLFSIHVAHFRTNKQEPFSIAGTKLDCVVLQLWILYSLIHEKNPIYTSQKCNALTAPSHCDYVLFFLFFSGICCSFFAL